VEDVVSAFANALGRSAVEGPAETYNLCGPRSYRFRELIEFTAEKLDKRRLIIGVPDWIAQLQGRAMECLPNPLFTWTIFIHYRQIARVIVMTLRLSVLSPSH
jgi:NADH dehydrogenase